MTNALYLRIKSLNTRTMRGVTSHKSVIRVAAMHNLREIQAELGASAASGITPARMHLNYQLRGPATADEVAGLGLALLDNAGVTTLRRDACMALELVVSLPANTAVDHREYFAAAVAWADTYFAVPILSAAVHLDEAAPHCHILLLPLVAGRMQGGALAGGPAKIRAMLADFQQQVAQRFGLTHQPRTKRLSKPNRDAAGRMVLDALRARPECMGESAMRDSLIAALGSQAETLLSLLGMSMPAARPKTKSFVDIMTAPCKPERARRTAPNTMHIDVAQNLGNQDSGKFGNVYHCVDVALASDVSPPTIHQPNSHTATTDRRPAHIEQTTRQQASYSSLAAPSRPASDMPVSDTGNPAPATGQQLERSTTDQAADEVQNQHPAARRILSSKDTALDATTSATMAHLLSFEDISVADDQGAVEAMPSAADQRQAAPRVQKILHPPLAVSARASTSAAIRPPVTPIMRADAGCEGSQNFLDTPSVATTNPGTDQAASTSPSPRRRAKVKRPVASSGAGTAKRKATAPAKSASTTGTSAGNSAHAAAHRQAAHRAPAALDQAAEQSDLDAGPTIATAPAKPSAAKRPAKAATTGPAVPVSATPKRPRKAATSRTATASSARTPAPAAPGNPAYVAATAGKRGTRSTASAMTAGALDQPAGPDGSEIYKRCPPSPVSTSTAPSVRRRTTATGTAKLASRAEPKLTSANRWTSTMAASRKASAQHQARAAAVGTKGLHTVQPPGGPSRQNIRDVQQPANHTPGQRRAPKDLGTRSHTDDVQQMDGIPAAGAITAMRGPCAAAADVIEVRKSHNDIDAGQLDDIRRLGVTVEPNASSYTTAAGSFSGNSEIREIRGFTGTALATSCGSVDAGLNQPDEIRTPGQPPVARQAPPLGGTRSAMPREPGHTLPPRHLLTLLGDQHQATRMLVLAGDLEQPTADRYQRHRDDDRPAELWDEQRGEFASAPPAAAKTRCVRLPPDEELARGWREAWPSTMDAAPSLI